MKHRYITRIDNHNTHSWHVRIAYGTDRQAVATFSDRKLGGKRRALKAAIAWRDQMIASLPAHYRITPATCGMSRRNKTGKVGVMLAKTVKWLNSGKRTYYAYIAYVGGHEQRKKSYAVQKYGKQAARAMAIAWRDREVAKVIRERIRNETRK
jgi:hypothetical protein